MTEYRIFHRSAGGNVELIVTTAAPTWTTLFGRPWLLVGDKVLDECILIDVTDEHGEIVEIAR